MEIRKGSIGDEDVARIYTGENIVHPLPVQDGLVLWYDFMGRKNSDVKRGIAEDLSGNGNDGELTNFAYEEGSGYKDGLRFDGVDDSLDFSFSLNQEFTISGSLEYFEDTLFFMNGLPNTYVRINDNRFMFYTWHENISGKSYFSGRGIYANKPLHFSMTFNPESVDFYFDGVLNTTTQRSSDRLYEGVVINSLGRWTSSNHSKVRFFSFSCYNRALTPEEVAHNYAIEKERWNL